MRRRTDRLYIRAPGQREREALEFVRAQPGITVQELADAMGVGMKRARGSTSTASSSTGSGATEHPRSAAARADRQIAGDSGRMSDGGHGATQMNDHP